ncbi:putative sulfate exporter family transporter [Pseudomonadales bacterium]|nr:putative sulfate exporter family transporter [Pseudomonadales bacterium]MDB9757186.1 putative sulfate exporter family transporter [Pseudomonadales bacterium]MDC1322570.1 putative sulfate exporter family transporter [Pseudomonadales bacterium]
MAVDETSKDVDENPNNNLGKDASDNTVKDPAQNQAQKSALAWLGVSLVLALGIYFQNPAYALLGALVLRLILDVNPIKQSGTIGKLSLQTAIVLLGFSLGIDSLMQMSSDYGLIVAVFVLCTLGLGLLMGRLLRSDEVETTLIASGTAICGGTAIATLAPLINAKPQQFAVATALVFLLNIIALLTFPYIGTQLGLSQEVFGAWVALAIHDTSSVMATATIYGDEAAQVAAAVKLGRTLWLIPLAFAVSLIYGRREAKIRVPTFVLLFVGMAIVSRFVPLEPVVVGYISLLSKTLLVIALAMIGLEINRQTLSQMSMRSIGLGVGLWIIVAPVALALVLYL